MRALAVLSATVFIGLAFTGLGRADVNPPNITSGPTLWTQDFDATFEFSGDADVTYLCRLEGPDWVDCTSPWSYLGLAEGEHNFKVRAVKDLEESNFTSYSWTIDVTPPVLPDDVVIEAVSSAGAIVVFSATDNLDLQPVLTCIPESGQIFALGPTSVSCSANDAAGNATNGGFNVTVVDTTAPVLEQHGDVLATQQSPQGAVVTYPLPGATDTVDSSPDVSCSPVSGATFPIGSTPVTCEASDDSGNESGVQFSVVVQQGPSPETPQLTADVPELTNKTSAGFQFSAEAGVSLECRLTGPGAPNTFAPCATDSSQSYSGLDEGAYLFTVQATNEIGNVSQKSYSWTIDRTKPAAVANFRARARDASVLLEWKKPVDADYDHVVIRRKRVGTTSWRTLAKRVKATSLKDTAVRNNVRYRYRIQSVDHARNPSAAVEIGGRPSKLFSPVFAAVLRSPPLIDWTYVKNASYFNVQVWRNGRKILSRWPIRTSLKMRSSWTYGGKQFSFSSGHYVVYAWPGFGSKAAASYGPLLGWTSFDVR